MPASRARRTSCDGVQDPSDAVVWRWRSIIRAAGSDILQDGLLPQRLMGSLLQFVRRVRYGRPIVVVSGLPRSGTSMMMQMLQAGGLEILTDAVRMADASNPKGYLEFEAVKDLDKGPTPAWLGQARVRLSRSCRRW